MDGTAAVPFWADLFVGGDNEPILNMSGGDSAIGKSKTEEMGRRIDVLIMMIREELTNEGIF